VNIKDIAEKIIREYYSKHYFRAKIKYPEFFDYMKITYGDLKPSEFFYIAIHGDEDKICQVSNQEKRFNGIEKGYGYCGNNNSCQCLAIDRGTLTKLGQKDIDWDNITNKIKQTNLTKYGVENPSQVEKFKQKRKNTNIDRYGVEYPASLNEFKQKVIKTNQERYGVDNPNKLDEIKQKVKDSCLKTYRERNIRHHTSAHYTNAHLLDDRNMLECVLLENGIKKTAKMINISIGGLYNYMSKHDIVLPNTYRSSYEILISEILEKNGIAHLISNRKILGNRKEIDILIDEHKIAIEINGNYYHTENNGKNKNYHYNKWKILYDKGYTLLSIMEDEFINNQQAWMNKILDLCNILYKSKVLAHDCKISEIDKETSKNFIKLNCVNNKNIDADYSLGLTYNGQLIALMQFMNTPTSKTAKLIRYCEDIHFNIERGANILLKKFIEDNDFDKIIGFSDNKIDDHKLYQNLGFDFVRNIPPEYEYVHKNNYLIRLDKNKFNKKFINENFDTSSKTTKKIMKEFGYKRIWDCGKKKWSMKL
jgi:very-short-patch-repair endonuclease